MPRRPRKAERFMQTLMPSMPVIQSGKPSAASQTPMQKASISMLCSSACSGSPARRARQYTACG